MPNSFNINEPVPLSAISEDSGWVGNRTDFFIYPHNCYEGEIDSLSWLSSNMNAQNWQYFVSDSTVDAIIDCNLGDLNYDGSLSVLDILILLDIILGNIDYDENGDMNYDQIFNIQDILILIQEILHN